MGVPIRNDHIDTLNFVDDYVIFAQNENDLGFIVKKSSRFNIKTVTDYMYYYL